MVNIYIYIYISIIHSDVYLVYLLLYWLMMVNSG